MPAPVKREAPPFRAREGHEPFFVRQWAFDAEGYHKLTEGLIGSNILRADEVPQVLSYIAALDGSHSRRHAYAPGCGMYYGPDSVEYRMFAAGLAALSWSLRIVERKTMDGHCWTHKKPCKKGREFTFSVLRMMVGQVRALALSHTWPSAPAQDERRTNIIESLPAELVQMIERSQARPSRGKDKAGHNRKGKGKK